MMDLMRNPCSTEVNKMKITKILPKPLAIAYQENDLNRTDGQLEYHRAMVRVLEMRSQEGHAELSRLEEKR